MKHNSYFHQYELDLAGAGLAQNLKPPHTLQILAVVSLIRIHEIAYYARIQLKSFDADESYIKFK